MWGATCLFLVLLGSMLVAPGHGAITEELSSATNNFTLDLLRASFNSESRNSNTILSPLSLYTVLAMVQQGAGGTTESELNQVLHAQPTSTKEGFKTLIQDLKKSRRIVELQFANKLFVKTGLNILPEFKTLSVEDFKSDIQELDFSQAEESAQIINSWVSNNTHQRIKEIITSDKIDAATALLLLNAIFFSGQWNSPFSESATVQKEFVTLGGETKNTPTMHLSRNILRGGHCACVNATFVHLPFERSEFSMLLVVPGVRDGLNNVVNNLKEDNLSKFIKFNDRRQVNLELPKFKFETTSELKETLQVMGLQDVFAHSANLHGITGQNLFVSDVRQKAEIEVDEHGAKASAATVVGISLSSAPILSSQEVLEIKADRPFLFFIVDNSNKVPLFSGWVGQP